MTRYLFSLLGFFLCISCNTGDRFNDTDLSSVDKVELDLRRLDRDVFAFEADSMDAAEHHLDLLENYGDIYRLYFQKMLGEGSVNGPMAHFRLKGFVEDINMQEVQEGVEKVHPDLQKEEGRIETAFRHYKHHFPDSTVPRKLIAYNGGFSYAIYPTDSLIAFGLEWFLGPEHRVIKRLPRQQFPDYKKAKMKPKYLVSEVLKGWVKFKRKERARDLETLLDHMIFNGKLLYTMDAMLPETADSIKIKYNDEEIAWVRQNENRIWQTFVDRELFFKEGQKTIRKLLRAAPFTSVLPRESPGRVGQWMGWQIVRAYMEKHPQMPLERMIRIEDAQRIFQAYKPEKNF